MLNKAGMLQIVSISAWHVNIPDDIEYTCSMSVPNRLCSDSNMPSYRGTPEYLWDTPGWLVPGRNVRSTRKTRANARTWQIAVSPLRSTNIGRQDKRELQGFAILLEIGQGTHREVEGCPLCQCTRAYVCMSLYSWACGRRNSSFDVFFFPFLFSFFFLMSWL